MNALAGLDTRQKALAGALVAALLLLVARFLLLGGGDETTTEPFDLGVPVAAAAAAGTPPEQPLPPADVPPPPPAGAAKDPFRALHVAGSGPAAGPTSVDPGYAPPVAPPVGPPLEPSEPLAPLPVEPFPVVQVPVGQVPADSGPVVQPGAPAAVRPVLVLRSVSGEGAGTTATFTLDDVEHTAKVGEAFAGLTVQALQQGPRPGQWTAVVQAAGEDPFDLVSGAPHRL